MIISGQIVQALLKGQTVVLVVPTLLLVNDPLRELFRAFQPFRLSPRYSDCKGEFRISNGGRVLVLLEEQFNKNLGDGLRPPVWWTPYELGDEAVDRILIQSIPGETLTITT